MVKVAGYCPACGSKTLFVGDEGHVTCSLLGCSDPGIVDRILSDRETEHVAVIGETNFTLLHPLRERGEDLFACSMHAQISAFDGPPVKPGRYRVTNKDGWRWTELGETP